jgi:cell fate (sporulation/competence/biofilm development) regulator YlbF (YheA/YmcA/DUF963 family)
LSNLYDKAYELEKAFRESDDFKTLKELSDKVNADPAAKQLFDSFRSVQMELQQKQMSGQQLTEEEITKAQQQVELIRQHEVIGKLMEQEQRVSMLVNDINKIILKPLEDIYGNGSESEQQ